MKELAVEEAAGSWEVMNDCPKDEYDTKKDELATPDGVFVKAGELVASNPLENSTDEREGVISVEVAEGLSRLAEPRLKKNWSMEWQKC